MWLKDLYVHLYFRVHRESKKDKIARGENRPSESARSSGKTKNTFWSIEKDHEKRNRSVRNFMGLSTTRAGDQANMLGIRDFHLKTW